MKEYIRSLLATFRSLFRHLESIVKNKTVQKAIFWLVIGFVGLVLVIAFWQIILGICVIAAILFVVVAIGSASERPQPQPTPMRRIRSVKKVIEYDPPFDEER